jgi:hypothetical protein
MLLNHLFYTTQTPDSPADADRPAPELAAYKRRKYAHVWPIDPKCRDPPEAGRAGLRASSSPGPLPRRGHPQGLRQCPEARRAGGKMGFRSCFSFVPERYGKISLTCSTNCAAAGSTWRSTASSMTASFSVPGAVSCAGSKNKCLSQGVENRGLHFTLHAPQPGLDDRPEHRILHLHLRHRPLRTPTRRRRHHLPLRAFRVRTP